MKRSEINTIIRKSDEFIHKHNFHLPPFAYWTVEDWQKKGVEAKEIVETSLGWDITDFGLGDYYHTGLTLFTIRNGNPDNWKLMKGKLYAEKLLIVDVNQVTPYHFHWAKMEDIINRGGGELIIRLFNSDAEEKLDEKKPVVVVMDGVRCVFPAGDCARLKPGESITLPQGLYHSFWAEKGTVLTGEVSMVNDDHKDNRFLEPVGRFPEIEEDEKPLFLLCNDYQRYFSSIHV